MANDVDPAKTAGEAQASKAKPEAAASSAPKDTVTLMVTAPFYQSAFIAELGDGEAVRFDHSGTDVPADKASEYEKLAEASGITLSVKEG